MLAKFVKAAFLINMALIGLGLVVIGGLFAFKLLTYDRAEASFEAPNGRWTVIVEDSCPVGACYKYPKVVVPTGWFSRHELQCNMGEVDTSRVLFDRVHKVAWSDNDTVLDWSAGEPAESGRLDLREDCYITAVFDDRPSSISLRFKENCLIGECRRSVSWLEAKGGFIFTTPCRVTAHGNAPVFTLPNDVRGQVSVTLDTAKQLASWVSGGTGQSGVIDFAADCDSSRQTRREQPA